MEPQSSLPDNELLVVDTSVVINLNATGCAKEILDALPQRVAVVDVVVGELEYGRSKGRSDAEMLADDGLHPSAAMYARWVGVARPVARRLLAEA